LKNFLKKFLTFEKLFEKLFEIFWNWHLAIFRAGSDHGRCNNVYLTRVMLKNNFPKRRKWFGV
jgi:hypothetical protein